MFSQTISCSFKNMHPWDDDEYWAYSYGDEDEVEEVEEEEKVKEEVKNIDENHILTLINKPWKHERSFELNPLFKQKRSFGHQKCSKHKTLKYNLCKKMFENGSCSYGNKCNFAHSLEEQSKRPDWGVINANRNKVCKHQKTCKFGINCHYIHN